MKKYGCKFNQPHRFRVLADTKAYQYEVCEDCGQKEKYKKGYKGRVNNKKYLEDHIRDLCQRGGATKRIFHRIYNPEKCIIKVHTNL